MSPRRLPLLAAILATLMLSACAPKLYTVNLSRPNQVGWKFALTSDISENSRSHTVMNIPGIAAPQNDDRDEEFIGHLEGDGEVLGVFPNGGLQKLAVTVKAISAKRGGKAVPGLPAAGAKIIMAREGDKIAISVEGKAVDKPVADVLNELILLDDDKATVQQYFGPKAPVKIGDTWPVDAAAVEAVLKSGLGGGSKGTNGAIKFESVSGSGDNEEATLAGNFVMDYKPGLPSTMKLDAAAINGTMTWTVPLNATKGAVKFTRDLNMKIEAHGTPNDAAVKLDVRGEQKRTMALTFH